ncbi:MAG: hypothetical protein IJ079_06815 [Lachnospiraceae bacterium]|nr:hypothetical protein [Lachnospiraceae bacterium]
MKYKNYTKNDNPRLLTIEEARQNYRMSRNLLMRIATECNAVRRFGRAVRIDPVVFENGIENY